MVIVTTEALRSRNDGREIVSLTILRAFAAWWVVIYHFKRMSPFTDGLDVFALRSGWIGVDVFFVLSGFVLACVYGPDIESQNFEFWQFLVKRFARIYPAHLFTLALMLAMITATVMIHARTSLASELSPDPSSNYDPMRTVLAQLLLIHAWGIDKIGHFNAPSWSISAEWFAYLIFPVIAPALLRLSPRRALAVGLAASLICNAIALVWLGVPSALLGEQFGIIHIAPDFCLGIAAFMLFRRAHVSPAIAIELLLATGFGLYLQSLLGAGLWLIGPLACCLVLSVSLLDASLPRGNALVRKLRYLGEISYSTYMIHTIVLILVWPLFTRFGGYGWGAQTTLFSLAGFLVLAGSAALYHWIEVPLRGWISRKAPRLMVARN
jgi:peptidoglycan/LPS O-acetylase OafA/YrhL